MDTTKGDLKRRSRKRFDRRTKTTSLIQDRSPIREDHQVSFSFQKSLPIMEMNDGAELTQRKETREEAHASEDESRPDESILKEALLVADRIFASNYDPLNSWMQSEPSETHSKAFCF